MSATSVFSTFSAGRNFSNTNRMKLIYPIIITALAIPAAVMGAPQSPAASADEPGVYVFRRPEPVTSLQTYATTAYTATLHDVHTLRGDILHSAGKDTITAFNLNPTGATYLVLENENGNGKRTATVYDTYLRDKKRARFNVKKRGIPFCATYSPDGRTLFVATDRGIFPADPRTLETGECLERTGSIPDMLLVSPNGYFLLAIAGDRCAVYNLEEGKVRKTLLTGQRITDAMFSPDSREMVLLSDDGMASVYNMNTLTVRKMIDGLGQARAGALNFDGKYLAVADRPDNIVLVNTLRDTDRTNIHVPDGDIRDLGFIYDAGRNTLMVYPVPGAVKARRMPLLKPYYNKLIDEEVNARMEEWLKMQPGETMEQYAARVTDETRAEQRRMFEYEVTTRLAGNLIAGQPVGIGEYNRANGMLALKPGDMPQIFINVPEEEATAFTDPALVSLSEVLYGVMDDDTFEIVYARVTNGVNGKSYIFDNRNRKPLDYMKGGDGISLQVLRQQKMEEVRLRELSERVVNEAKNMNVISDHTNISVASRVVEDYDANGRRILNYEVSFTYDVAPGFSAQEDFPSGKYHVEQSGAASSMLKIVRQAFAGDLEQYLGRAKKVRVKLAGSADATPIRSGLPYDGSFGDFDQEPVYVGGQLTALSVDSRTPVRSNEQLAFLRAIAVRDFLEKNVPQYNALDKDYRYEVTVSEGKGSEFRRITAEFTFVDVF